MRKRLLQIAALAAATAVTVGCATTGGPDGPLTPTPEPDPLGWSSGAWVGSSMSADSMSGFGRWRDRPVHVATTYPAHETWQELENSSWHVDTFDGFPGRLSYGLPLLPTDEPATLEEVASGAHDEVFEKIARHLVDAGRGDSYVRLGWEANGTWSPWGATAETAPAYREAYRQVVTVMRRTAPDLRFVFDITCGTSLTGSEDRMASFTAPYPGDDVVDVIGCDIYDWHQTKAETPEEWAEDVLAPDDSPGLDDLARFGRERNKPIAVPEWGLAAVAQDGNGDNPFYVEQMFAWFEAHAEQLEYEAYFDENSSTVHSSLWQTERNPKSAAAYRRLWGIQ